MWKEDCRALQELSPSTPPQLLPTVLRGLSTGPISATSGMVLLIGSHWFIFSSHPTEEQRSNFYELPIFIWQEDKVNEAHHFPGCLQLAGSLYRVLSPNMLVVGIQNVGMHDSMHFISLSRGNEQSNVRQGKIPKQTPTSVLPFLTL